MKITVPCCSLRWSAFVATWIAIAVAAGCAGAPSAARVDEADLVASGFKTLVATTSAQEAWVKGMPPGQIRPMQRNEKKFWIYPDAAQKRIYIGGPQEYEAYVQRLPESQRGKAEADAAARQAANRADYARRSEAMSKATARDLSDPFLGYSWADLGY